jgi:Fur family transcriptional regulator, ferric uptake regulator
MAEAPGTPAPVFSTLDEAVSVLRSRGLRVSTPRRILLEALLGTDRLVTAEEIAEGLDGRGQACDVSVVYRNLETLEALGLVRHVHLGHGPGRYALATGGEREYLVCERCGEARAVPPKAMEPIRREIRDRFGYVARFTHFPVSGLCGACAAKEDGRGE